METLTLARPRLSPSCRTRIRSRQRLAASLVAGRQGDEEDPGAHRERQTMKINLGSDGDCADGGFFHVSPELGLLKVWLSLCLMLPVGQLLSLSAQIRLVSSFLTDVVDVCGGICLQSRKLSLVLVVALSSRIAYRERSFVGVQRKIP